MLKRSSMSCCAETFAVCSTSSSATIDYFSARTVAGLTWRRGRFGGALLFLLSACRQNDPNRTPRFQWFEATQVRFSAPLIVLARVTKVYQLGTSFASESIKTCLWRVHAPGTSSESGLLRAASFFELTSRVADETPSAISRRWRYFLERAAANCNPVIAIQRAPGCGGVQQEANAEIAELSSQHFHAIRTADLLQRGAEFAVGADAGGDVQDHGEIARLLQPQAHLGFAGLGME